MVVRLLLLHWQAEVVVAEEVRQKVESESMALPLLALLLDLALREEAARQRWDDQEAVEAALQHPDGQAVVHLVCCSLVDRAAAEVEQEELQRLVDQAEAAVEVHWVRCLSVFQEEAAAAAAEGHLHWALLLLACLVEAVHLSMAKKEQLQTAEQVVLEAVPVSRHLLLEEGAVEMQLETMLLVERVGRWRPVEQAVCPNLY